MKLQSFLTISIIAAGMISCQSNQTIKLFNGEDLENWTIFVPEGEIISPGELFWVEDGVINVKGVPYGYIRTKEVYSNFKLHVEWRWTAEPKNSGVLIHVQGEDMIWPLSLECQLKYGSAGDFVLIGEGSGITVGDATYLVKPGERRYKSLAKFEEDSENAPGEWNVYDINVRDGDVEISVNGVVQNRGTNPTLTEGNILLQSEGGPMQFRNLYLIPQ